MAPSDGGTSSASNTLTKQEDICLESLLQFSKHYIISLDCVTYIIIEREYFSRHVATF